MYIFKANQYRSLIVLLGFSIALFSINSLLISILNGFKEFKKFIIVNIVSNFLSLGITLLLVLRFGLYGALLNCVVSQSIIIGVTVYFLYREPWFVFLFKKASFDWAIARDLGSFSVMALTSALIVPFSQLMIRSFIVSHLSINDAGIWEGMNRLSGMYLLLITTSIGIYYLPRLAEIKENVYLRSEIIKTMKIVMPTLCIAFFLVYLSRNIVIWMIFSQEFASMRDLFIYQLIGDTFRVASSLIAFLFWAKGMARAYIICEVLFNLTLIVSVQSGVKYFGLEGSVYGYAVTYFLYLIAMLFIFRNLLFYQESKP
jgi:PST family polysaccharide transporter